MPSLSPWLNVLVFIASGAVIWWAGSRLEHQADELTKRTSMGQAFAGMLLLAVATSLPELATTITAVVFLNDATLAINNLLGGVALQTALIGVADAAKRERGALTSFRPEFPLLIQGVGVVLISCVVLAGITAGGRPVVFGVSVWLVLLIPAYLAIARLSYLRGNDPRWQPTDTEANGSDGPPAPSSPPRAGSQPSLRRIWVVFGALSLVVLAAGWFATHAAESFAKDTGLGSAFVGATLLTLATSLPELSTTTLAARRRRYSVAISNVFGSNAFDICLLLLADLLFREGTILAHAETTAVFVLLVGAVMTCIYLLGMLERNNRTVLGIGRDSAVVLLVYGVGMAVLYFMRDA